MWHKFSFLIIMFFFNQPTFGCGSWNEQELFSMSGQELKRFFKVEKEKYIKIAELVSPSKNIPHITQEGTNFSSLVRTSATKIEQNCVKISLLATNAAGLVQKINREEFLTTQFSHILEKYSKYSRDIDVNKSVYYRGLEQMARESHFWEGYAQFKIVCGSLMLGYSVLGFFVFDLFITPQSNTDYYYCGTLAGIGLCLFFEGLYDFKKYQGYAEKVKKAIKDTDYIWALTQGPRDFDSRKCILI